MDSLPTMPATATTTTTEVPLPPPYTPMNRCYFTRAGDEEEEEEQETVPSTNITFNAPMTIHGSNNIVSFPSADFTRMAAMIIATVQKTTVQESLRNISINLNCGITVVGQRNVIGSVGVRPMALRQQLGQQAAAASDTVAQSGLGTATSSKRKAEEVCFRFQVILKALTNMSIGCRSCS
jgi:hypothetical protein